MTDTTTMAAESERQGGFYVPRFELKIAGAGLPRDVLFDVREITYEDSLDQIDSFTMTVNNWDDDERVFKYIGSERAALQIDGSLFACRQIGELKRLRSHLLKSQDCLKRS